MVKKNKDGKHLFVYGTLKEGHQAHKHYMQDFKKVKSCRTSPDYSLYITPHGFPGMTKESALGKKYGVFGEVYAVDSFTDLDSYESIRTGLFRRETIELEDGTEAMAYIFNQNLKGGVLVEGGEYTNETLESALEEMNK